MLTPGSHTRGAAFLALAGAYKLMGAQHDLVVQFKQPFTEPYPRGDQVIDDHDRLPVSQVGLRVCVNSKIVGRAHQEKWRQVAEGEGQPG